MKILLAAAALLVPNFASALGMRGQLTDLDSGHFPVLDDSTKTKSDKPGKFKVVRPNHNDDTYHVETMRNKLLESSSIPDEHVPTKEKLESVREKLFDSIPSDEDIEKKIMYLKSPEGQEDMFLKRMQELKETPWSVPGQEFANCVHIFNQVPGILEGDLTTDELDALEIKCIDTNADDDFGDGYCADLGKQFAFQYPGLPTLAKNNVDHACTYVTDWIDPLEEEPECMKFMFELTFEQAMTHNHGLTPFPLVIAEEGFDTTYMTVCENVESVGHTETCAAHLKNVMPLADKKYSDMVDFLDDLCSALGTPIASTTPVIRNPEDRYKKRHSLVDMFEKVQQRKYGMVDKAGQPTSPAWLDEDGLSPMLLGATDLSSSVCSGRAYTLEVGLEVAAGLSVGASASVGFGFTHKSGNMKMYGASASYWSVCAGVVPDIGFSITFSMGYFQNYGNIAGYSITTEVEVDLIILSVSSGPVECCDGSGATEGNVNPSKFTNCKVCGGVGGVGFGLGLNEMPIGWSQAYCYSEEIAATKEVAGPFPEAPGEGWTDCMSNNMAWGEGYKNRDAMAAAKCREDGFDGVAPNSYKHCGCGGGYSFTCENTSNEPWTPCYRDEDGAAMGVGNRDDAGRAWCKRHGYHTWRDYQDCGNWYFRFKCIKEQKWSPCFRDEQARAAGYKNRDDQGRAWCRNQGYADWIKWYDCGDWWFKFLCSD